MSSLKLGLSICLLNKKKNLMQRVSLGFVVAKFLGSSISVCLIYVGWHLFYQSSVMPVFFVKAILIRNHILLILFYRRDILNVSLSCKMSLIPFFNGEVLWFILHQSNMFLLHYIQKTQVQFVMNLHQAIDAIVCKRTTFVSRSNIQA